jgi:putative ABC transport system ATP-binding protein
VTDPLPLVDGEAGAAVSIAELSKVYQAGESAQGGRVVSVTAADTVSLDLLPGTVTALTGPSGSGKSTLLRMVGGLERPDAGIVSIDGETVTLLDRADLAAYRRRVGFLAEEAELLPALTVLANVLAPALPPSVQGQPVRTRLRQARRRRAALRERAYRLLALVDLVGLEGVLPDRLSPVEQQRAALARALINRPGLLLADEPTGRCGSRAGEELMALLLRLREDQGLTIMLATHDPEVAIRCDRVIRLRDGAVIDDSEALP